MAYPDPVDPADVELGVCVPNYRPGAGPDGILAAAETAERLGWTSAWTTDHVLVDRSERASDYAHIYEALTTLAWLGGRTSRIRLGISVLVVPMRNAVILAKELATIDALIGGRLIAGVGIGWSREEFEHLGVGERFGHRGAFLEETVALWRALWGGAEGPYEGRYDGFGEVRFSPLPPQGADLPVWIGAHADVAIRRVGRIAEGYQSTRTGPDAMRERGRLIREVAEEAGRPMPVLASRVGVDMDAPADDTPVLNGSPDDIAARIRAYAAAGVSQLTLDFRTTAAERVAAAIERFDREVVGQLRAR